MSTIDNKDSSIASLAPPPREEHDGPPAHDEDTRRFLIELGQRVRNMRAIRGMSRKVLAQVSGVSERYIAQLESGLGNVSVVLLRRVAKATAAPIEDLIAGATDSFEEWPLLRSLLREASTEQIDEVKDILTGQRQPRKPLPRVAVDRIALIGLRGAGKSTLGRRAAKVFGWPFIELNKEVEHEAGFSMNEILSLYGQEGYRRLEQAALRKVIARQGPMIVATGGSVVSDPVTFELLLTSFFTIWIKATPEEHMSRVRKQGDLRPMGNDSAAMSELMTILSSREPFYSRARLVVDTSGASEDACVQKLLEAIRSYCQSGCPWQSRNREQLDEFPRPRVI
ncbi:MAG: helix-turn-helix domain-containing protein [Xanthobacteraceae bacterium]|nr:MAG: helix-turn-helix domain-containing protein [Xanthobacteraceae bacterium]